MCSVLLCIGSCIQFTLMRNCIRVPLAIQSQSARVSSAYTYSKVCELVLTGEHSTADKLKLCCA